MSRLSQVGHRLYTGETSFDFVGRKKLWYLISAGILVVSVISLLTLKLNFGIEFKGGAEFRVPSATCSIEDARSTAEEIVPGEIIVQEIGSDDLRVQTPPVETGQANEIRDALASNCDANAADISVQVIGPAWGGEVTDKALLALVVFLLFVVAFIWIAFTKRMAIAAIVALAHDILITVGVYSLTGFDVTPSTVIGLLTILGYSLYDTVVVFDSIRENTKNITAQSRMTYSEAANLSVNQTLVRSINTSVIALLPIGSILVVGAYFLGAGTLKDLSLVLFIGILASTYSSIFIATPLLADLEERTPEMKGLARRVAARRAGELAASGSAPRKPSPDGSRTATAVLDPETEPVADADDPVPGAEDRRTEAERRQPQRSTRAQRKDGNRGPRR